MGEDNTVAIVAIAVSGGVALIAAIIAPVTAHYRQKRALRAESERQMRQLAHDRLLRDIEETRTRLDEVVDMGEAALSAICEARLAFNGHNRQACDDQLWQARQCLGQYGYKERRVRLRIGHDHELIESLGNFRRAVQALFDLTHGHVTKESPVPPDPWNNGMATVAAAQVALSEAGKRAVGVQIAPRKKLFGPRE